MAPDLPIEALIPEIRRTLREGGGLVVQAPPGAGKTTRIPPALLDEDWLAGGRIVMLEPRRLATRAAAARMAASRGEDIGQTVGYRMRMDSRIGRDTRIEVVTDGILLRMLQDDPGLDGIGAVIFDEVHERGLDSDLGMILSLETQRYLRPELRLIAMSATLDGERVASLLGAPILRSEGRAFPVETRYLPYPERDRLEDKLVAGIRHALADETGSVLAFLPGGGEIRAVERRLAELDLGPGIDVAPLYGELSQAAQDAALLPAAAGRRKIVLATSIAETSLTIEGIRIVIDSGKMRLPRFEPKSGMTRLETVAVSQASAEQRRGRAGRTEPGVCYRLWSAAEQRILPKHTPPEILVADLAPLALEIACWGADPGALPWLDPPPPAPLAAAQDLLRRLGGLDAGGAATPRGREMVRLGLHPRLAHMLLEAKRLGLAGLACDVAAILSARDPLKPGTGARDSDLRLRVDLVGGAVSDAPGISVDRTLLRQIRQQAGLLRRRIGTARDRTPESDKAGSENTGLLLALAYPDRIGQSRPGRAGEYRLSNGRGAVMRTGDPLAREDYLAIAELDGDKRAARIFLAAPIALAEIELGFADEIAWEDSISWDSRERAVLARRRLRLDQLVLRETPLDTPPVGAVTAALLAGIREAGIDSLPWSPASQQLRARVNFLRQLHGAAWPDFTDASLLDSLEDWLAVALDGATRLAHLERLAIGDLLRNRLDWAQQKTLDTEAPTHLTVPSGSRLPIDYIAEGSPVLAVRLQEMFGATETPRIAGGSVPVKLHLLSPAGRPLQVTSDLAGFWANSYRAVRAEMRGRYPKHPWPEDPAHAVPTSRTKRRSTG